MSATSDPAQAAYLAQRPTLNAHWRFGLAWLRADAAPRRANPGGMNRADRN
jgi:hypothetical protein